VAGLGMMAGTTGTIPACAGAVLGELYPHPKDSITSNNTEAVFITYSVREFPYRVVYQKTNQRVSGPSHGFVKKMFIPFQAPRGRNSCHVQAFTPTTLN